MPTPKSENVEIPKGNWNNEVQNKLMPRKLLESREGENHLKRHSSFALLEEH